MANETIPYTVFVVNVLDYILDNFNIEENDAIELAETIGRELDASNIYEQINMLIPDDIKGIDYDEDEEDDEEKDV